MDLFKHKHVSMTQISMWTFVIF